MIFSVIEKGQNIYVRGKLKKVIKNHKLVWKREGRTRKGCVSTNACTVQACSGEVRVWGMVSEAQIKYDQYGCRVQLP